MADRETARGRQTLKAARKLAILVIGSTLVALGLVLLVLPGPGGLVIIAGLAVLAIEFAWAARLLEKAKEKAQRAKDKAKGLAFRRRRPHP
ncbi:MAG: PGPGW domain-containing protein [Acidimicrobiia bacterium]